MNEKHNEIIVLPPPSPTGPRCLEETLAQRRSVREFSGDPLQDSQLSQLLWALQGITHDEGMRTTPSAGALYPLELYVTISAGLYHYEPGKHRLHRREMGDLRTELRRAALDQEAIVEAPVTFVIAAVYDRTARRYGHERAQRYIDMEVGHAAQNLLLQAVALGLGSVVIGAFDDQRVSRVLRLPADESPRYLIPVGHPRK